jgi:PTH1 family peptidyl-tRNA hydrolase
VERTKEVKLVVGIGNPGREYEGTRHNAGFLVVDRLSARHGVPLRRQNMYNAETGRGVMEGESAALAKPLSYVNLSGPVVAKLARDLEAEVADVLVVCDDFALPIGKLRLRNKGSDGGHNGLRSILSTLGTQDVPRLRLGIGAVRGDDAAGYVLGRFNREESKAMDEAYDRAADCVELWIREGSLVAMDRYN